jgi:hypothetical protein
MPCANQKLTQQQEQSRKQELKSLERQIEAGVVTVKVNGESVEFVGWKTDRVNPGHWHDDCAYRTLMAEGSSALRMALARQQSQPDRMARRSTA